MRRRRFSRTATSSFAASTPRRRLRRSSPRAMTTQPAPDRTALDAFCKHVDIRIPGRPGGPLAGLDFAAKDIFDVAGQVCCCGNPDWLASHPPAARTAPVVARLLDAGATLVGKTITDELAYSLN